MDARGNILLDSEGKPIEEEVEFSPESLSSDDCIQNLMDIKKQLEDSLEKAEADLLTDDLNIEQSSEAYEKICKEYDTATEEEKTTEETANKNIENLEKNLVGYYNNLNKEKTAFANYSNNLDIIIKKYTNDNNAKQTVETQLKIAEQNAALSYTDLQKQSEKLKLKQKTMENYQAEEQKVQINSDEKKEKVQISFNIYNNTFNELQRKPSFNIEF